MGQYDIKGLFRKLSQGTISEEELTHLNKWMDSNQEGGLSNLIDEDWSGFNQTEEVKSAPRWMTESKSKPTPKLNPTWKRSWAVAASVLIILAAGIGYFAFETNSSTQFVNKTNLDLPRELIELPDGSKVWLKRNSSLSYENFGEGQERIIKLSGEAFFEVRTDSTRPFIVFSDYLTTNVLGTSFNVISGNELIEPEVALKEGSVEVSYIQDEAKPESVILKPGEKVSLDKSKKEIVASSYLEDQPYAWKDGILFFEKTDIQEVARILETWYNIKFTVDVDPSQAGGLEGRYNTNKMKLEEVLEGITTVMPYKFELQSDASYEIIPK